MAGRFLNENFVYFEGIIPLFFKPKLHLPRKKKNLEEDFCLVDVLARIRQGNKIINIKHAL